ncbi:MAG: HAMP domain-containing sensor histidine kinase [Pseudomonadota bacterium]
MTLSRLVRTTAFRFTFLYVLVFAVAVGALGAFFYNSTFAVVDRQTDDIINQDLAVLADVFRNEGPGTLRRVLRERAAWRDDGVYIMIASPAGAVLAGNLTALPEEALGADEDFFDFSYERAAIDAAGRAVGEETRRGRGKLRRFKVSPEAQSSFLVFVARDITSHMDLRERSQQQITRIGAATIALGLLIGLVSSRSLLNRVEAVNRTARAIRDGDLTRRIKLTGSEDELDHLSANLNVMLDQIERLMSGMREVSDNIAHDLRSPLTRIRARLNDALKADHQQKDEALRATLRDAERMIATFNELLSIARIESGEGAGAMEPLDLVALAKEMAELYEPAVQDAGFRLDLRLKPCPEIRGSRPLVGQALANMLDNALKYAEGAERIAIEAAPLPDGRVMLAVADDGPGIPKAERSSVLKRFVRLERSRTSEGSGLGLSLVAAVARAHRAALRLSDARRDEPEAGRPGLRISLVFSAPEH